MLTTCQGPCLGHIVYLKFLSITVVSVALILCSMNILLAVTTRRLTLSQAKPVSKGKTIEFISQATS